MSASLQQIVTDLRTALDVRPLVCGSLTLNFDADGQFQSFETKTHQRIAKVVDTLKESRQSSSHIR